MHSQKTPKREVVIPVISTPPANYHRPMNYPRDRNLRPSNWSIQKSAIEIEKKKRSFACDRESPSVKYLIRATETQSTYQKSKPSLIASSPTSSNRYSILSDSRFYVVVRLQRRPKLTNRIIAITLVLILGCRPSREVAVVVVGEAGYEHRIQCWDSFVAVAAVHRTGLAPCSWGTEHQGA